MAAPAEYSKSLTNSPEVGHRELRELRLLTEVNHLRHARNYNGTYPDAVLDGVSENLIAKVQEDAMSGAVSVSTQPLAIVRAENGEHRRTFLWRGLGKTALEVARSGYRYHVSDPAYLRVGVEVHEAARTEVELSPGIVQSLVSPRMSRKDAPYEVAKMEHLADEDAIRTASAVLNSKGEIVALRRKSLLVRDIPLEAWVAMFHDPKNIFGKGFDIEDEQSALSIMKLFDQLDLPEESIPEGPVTIVAGVIPYIKDTTARSSVEYQLVKFRADQERLRIEAETTAREWLRFEEALARSLDTDTMQPEVLQLVLTLQTKWSQETLELLARHENTDSGYSMSTELAAHLEEAWQKAYLGEVAIAIGDERALKDVDPETAHHLQTSANFIRSLQHIGYNPAVIASLRAQQIRAVAISGVQPGGGCSGVNQFRFSDQNPGQGSEDVELLPSEDNRPDTSSEGIGETSFDVCRTEGCPSRPAKTKVGGCKVCLKYCQPLWDQGINPQAVYKTQPDPEAEGEGDNELSTRISETLGWRNIKKAGELVLANV